MQAHLKLIQPSYLGDTPKIQLVLETSPINPEILRLKSPTEEEIKSAVLGQFDSDNLV